MLVAVSTKRQLRARDVARGPEVAGQALTEAEHPVTVPRGAYLGTGLVTQLPVQTRGTPVLAVVALDTRRARTPSCHMVTCPAILTRAYAITAGSESTL